MAMNRQNYLEMVISFLSKLKNETGFNLESPLDHNSRISLAALANSADNMGEPQIGRLIKKALQSNDPKTQEILLYSGLQSGPVSEKDIQSAFQVASDKLQSMGGNPDSVSANAVEPPRATDIMLSGENGEDPLSGLLDEPAEEDPLGDIMGDDEGSENEEPSDEEPPEESEEQEEEMPEDEDGEGRIAKEGEPEEFEEAPPEPQPMNDWYRRFELDEVNK